MVSGATLRFVPLRRRRILVCFERPPRGGPAPCHAARCRLVEAEALRLTQWFTSPTTPSPAAAAPAPATPAPRRRVRRDALLERRRPLRFSSTGGFLRGLARVTSETRRLARARSSAESEDGSSLNAARSSALRRIVASSACAPHAVVFLARFGGASPTGAAARLAARRARRRPSGCARRRRRASWCERRRW